MCCVNIVVKFLNVNQIYLHASNQNKKYYLWIINLIAERFAHYSKLFLILKSAKIPGKICFSLKCNTQNLNYSTKHQQVGKQQA